MRRDDSIFGTGLVSDSFRKHSPAEILAAAGAAGLRSIEWGSDVHMPPTDLSKARGVAERTRDAAGSVQAFALPFIRCGVRVFSAWAANAIPVAESVAALLDVTDPEPPVPNSPFFDLENCILTPHIAGSLGDEVHRMSETVRDEFLRLRRGEPVRYEVTEKMFATMA